MDIHTLLTDDSILEELGKRLSHQRIQQGLTQAMLAKQAGISKRTLERAESGASIQLSTFIRILRVLDGLSGLSLILPEDTPSPIEMLKTQQSQRRKRVRAKSETTETSKNRKERTQANNWEWDD